MKSYAIANVDGSTGPGDAFLGKVATLSCLGVDFIQLRAKGLDARSLYDLARKCRVVIAKPSRFLVNGRADVAIATGADGVHLPARGLPAHDVRTLRDEIVTGVSCHTIEECRIAAASGVDYLLFGPLYPARSKDAEARVTLDDLREVAELPLDVFALGGVTVDRLREIAMTGVAGVAAITMFMNDEPIGEIVERVRRT